MRKKPEQLLTNPFVGLRAFEENEDYLFFGRSNQIGDLLRILGESRFLAVIGSSGSGKSSLVKSGLLPAIYSGFMTVGSNWRAVTMRPGEDPIGYLTKALAAEGILHKTETDSDIPYEWFIETSLRRSENGLVQVYKEAQLPPKESLLVVVDQFEELFRFSRYEKENKLGKSDAIHFIQILLAAVQQKEFPIYVLLTMRADFLGDCAEFRGLPEAINDGQYLIPRMKRDEIREAITGPVAVSSATISQRLVTRLLNDLNNDTDQLPILQHALMRTWDAWYKRGDHQTPIDFEDYEKIGTMASALSIHADEAYAELAPATEQKICELMFKALTDKAADIRGIRRPRSIDDLTVLTNGSEEQVKKVVEVFRKTGRTFLMPPPVVPLAQTSIIDISHESLMRVWERLRKWIDEEARSGDIYLRLANSARLKEEGQRGLLKNPELAIALRWKDVNNPSAKWAEGYKADFVQAMAYLEASRVEDLAEQKVLADKERTRKRLVRAVVFLLSILVVAGVIIGIILNRARENAIADKIRAEQLQKEANAEKKKAEAERKRAEAQRVIADTLAQREKRSADEAKSATDAKQLALDLAEEREAQARTSAAIASQKTKEALDEKQKANDLLEKTRQQNLKIAANEYARLIREGPSDENRNRGDFYGKNYFLLYARYFNELDSLTQGDDHEAYRTLREKLYYNNDLYKRIYENAKHLANDQKKDERVMDSLLLELPKSGPPPRGTDAAVGLQQNVIALRRGTQTLTDTLRNKGQEYVAYTRSKRAGRLLFASTTDNYIFVYNDRLQRVDTINMGARVTALDVLDEGDKKSIVYFGTANGYIGYIQYEADKKNQPVFENKLDSKITAIELFSRQPPKGRRGGATAGLEYFLLAAGLTSSPRVYKLDPATLTPNKVLLGNELPYQRRVMGEIRFASYDGRRVRLYTPEHTYLWNPFADELLRELNNTVRERNKNVDLPDVAGLKFYE